MSPRNLPLFLSDEASADIEDILQYTLETWGGVQMDEYGEILDDALSTIQCNPYIGHSRFDLSPIHRGKHIVIYKIDKDAVYISRVLHSRMDISRHM